MSEDRSAERFGFFRALASIPFGQVVWSADFMGALVLSAVGSVLLNEHVPDVTSHQALAADALMVASAVFGVVLAGFAIVAAFLGDRYSRLIAAAGTSTYNLLRHFIVDAGVFLVSIVCLLVYRVAATKLEAWNSGAEAWGLWLCLFAFLWALFQTLALMTLVFGIAVTSTQAPGGDSDS